MFTQKIKRFAVPMVLLLLTNQSQSASFTDSRTKKFLLADELTDINFLQPQQVVAKKQHKVEELEDSLAIELPIALVYNGISHVVLMATPTNIINLAVGFSLSEAIVPSIDAIYDITIKQVADGLQVDLQISSQAFANLKQRRRQLTGRTGCGVCGIESLMQLDLNPLIVTNQFKQHWLRNLPNALALLKQNQPINQITGCMHAAAWVTHDKQLQIELVKVFEDVGRHNALDKLLGYLAIHNADIQDGYVLMTSRASFELVNKCSRLNIAMLACISAATSLAVTMAQRSNITLLGFCRNDNYVIYHQSA